MKFRDLYENEVPVSAKEKLFERIRPFKPFLEMTGYVPWFRGVSDFGTVSSLEVIRTDRKPRSSSYVENNFFNLYAETQFNESHVRNRCLFAQKSISGVQNYGRVNLIFLPEDAYVLASPAVHDLYKLNPVGKFSKYLFDKNSKIMNASDRCLKLMGDMDPVAFDSEQLFTKAVAEGIDKFDVSSFIYETRKYFSNLEYNIFEYNEFNRMTVIPGNHELMVMSHSGKPYLRVDGASFMSLFHGKEDLKSMNPLQVYQSLSSILKSELS